jgi:hypothetical protein
VAFSNDIISFSIVLQEYPHLRRPTDLPFSLELFVAVHYDFILGWPSAGCPSKTSIMLAPLQKEEEEQ